MGWCGGFGGLGCSCAFLGYLICLVDCGVGLVEFVSCGWGCCVYFFAFVMR